MVSYNIPENVTSLDEIIYSLNATSDGFLMLAFTIMIFGIIFFLTKNNGAETNGSILAASFVASLISLVLVAANMLSVEILMIYLGLLAVSFFMSRGSYN